MSYLYRGSDKSLMKSEEKSAGYFSGSGMSFHETRHEVDYRNVLLNVECRESYIYLPFATDDVYMCYLTQIVGVHPLH